MKPPSHPQPGPAQQGKEVSEAMAPKGNPNQNLLPRFQGGEVKYDKFDQLTRDIFADMLDLEGRSGRENSHG